MTRFVIRPGLAALLFALFSLQAPAQLPEGTSREQMWPAPTKADWEKPCLITWQRTWEDAVAVSRATKKPILICVNMDGEIASEHYAGIRYRQPEITKLYEPYVCVIASTYRHTPRDHDENGHRVPCPRFGGVTCGEHIAIEPILFEKYFEGQRIAPRHIMVELEGDETYDVFYAWDTDSVFKTINDGIANREIKPEPQVKGDRPIIERVSSPDVADRVAVEEAFVKGDDALKRAMLETAAKLGDRAPLELLRLALSSFDEEMNALARKALAAAGSPESTELIADALRAQMSADEKQALIAALDRLGETSPQAKTLAIVHRGLGGGSRTVDAKGWAATMTSTEAARNAYERSMVERLSRQTELAASEDPQALLDVAEAQLGRALETSAEGRTDRMVRRALFEDARRNALKAEGLGATGWRPNEILAVVAWSLGETDEARTRAVAAAADVPADASSYSSMVVLGLFAEARRQAISDAVRDRKDWPGEWLTDLHAAYSILSRHPFGDDSQVVMHYDFLMWLRAFGQAEQTLAAGLRRYPASAMLHDRYRTRLLRRRGVTGIEEGYEELLAEPEAPAAYGWFAGYASLVAAEFHRRAGRDEAALAAYDRGIARYEALAAAEEDSQTTARHYIAMAHGGMARIAYEAKDDARALEELLRSFAVSPDSAATLDGLNISAVDTAKMLRARFVIEEKTAMLKTLEEALSALDPRMLELPAYEGVGPRPGDRQGRRPRDRRNRGR